MCAEILIVDNELGMCKLLFDLLESGERHVDIASSAEEALEKIKESNFDLIISDISMPGMSGIDLLKKIREINIESVVIFITAYGSVNTAVEAMKLGAKDYIEKPLDFDEFKSLVLRILDEQAVIDVNDKYLNKKLYYILKGANFGAYIPPCNKRGRELRTMSRSCA